MNVMPAGMHHSGIFRGIRKARVFLNRQGIHISPQHQEFPRLPAVYFSNDSRAAGALLVRNSHPLQFTANQAAGFVLMKRQLRISVNLVADFQKMRFQLI